MTSQGSTHGGPEAYRIVVPPELAVDGRALTAAMAAMGMSVTREPVHVESGEDLQPVWVGAADFISWAATQPDYNESKGSYVGTRMWRGVLRVVVDASVMHYESPLVLSGYPDDLPTWERYYANRDAEFGQLDLRSMERFTSQLRRDAGARTGSVFETFINESLPRQVGFETFNFWERFTRDRMREVRASEQEG